MGSRYFQRPENAISKADEFIKVGKNFNQKVSNHSICPPALPPFFPSNNYLKHLSPASEASREVANLTERKNTHTPVYGVKKFVSLSVCNKL